jgi:hypothetical protein
MIEPRVQCMSLQAVSVTYAQDSKQVSRNATVVHVDNGANNATLCGKLQHSSLVNVTGMQAHKVSQLSHHTLHPEHTRLPSVNPPCILETHSL